MAPLADRLNQLEVSGHRWTHNSVTDTGPLLRLDGNKLTRTEAYDNPTEREIYNSSIPVTQLKEEVVNYYRKGYRGIQPKYNWTWKEVKALGEAK